MSSATILVTGCAGFIGSHLCERLLREGYQVIGLDNFDPFYAREIKEANLAGCRRYPAFSFHEADICAGKDSFPRVRVDAVAHLAARAGVSPSIHDPVAYLETNLLGTLHVLEWMRQQGVSKLFFASSSSVYGNLADKPFREEAYRPAACISPYAASKAAAEELLFTYHHLHGIDTLAARFFTVYGPRQRPDLAIYKFMRLLREEQPVPVFGDGTTARDYTFVLDVVDGIARGLRYVLATRNVFEVVNMGNSQPVSLLELIDVLSEVLNVTPRLAFYPQQAGDVTLTFADISKARALLGYSPQTSLLDGLQQFAAWLPETFPAVQRR